ncbi:acyl-CoA dehydrogenase family protein [Jatrophihabitans fulvus]
MTETGLLDTDVEAELRGSLRDALARRCRPTNVAGVYDGDRGSVDPLWRLVVDDLGLAALLVAEEFGGVGASAREAAVVVHELGRAMAPVPYLTSAVIATTLLGHCPGDLLVEVAAGRRTVALVTPFASAPWGDVPTVDVSAGRVTGRITGVAGAIEADVLLVPAGDGAVYAVEADRCGVRPVTSLDMTRQLGDVTFDGSPAELLLGDAGTAVHEALAIGSALLASEQTGVTDWCIGATVAYLKERRQFGRVVGGFQALKHRLADLSVDAELAGAAAAHAAATVAVQDPDSEIAGAVAAAFTGDLAVLAAEETVQLHGGIGMAWEHPAHLYLKRAKADQIALGTPGAHRARLGDLVAL